MEFFSEEDAQKVLNQPANYLLKKQVSVQPTKNKIQGAESNGPEERNIHRLPSINELQPSSYFQSDLTEKASNLMNNERATTSYVGDIAYYSDSAQPHQELTFCNNYIQINEKGLNTNQQFGSDQFDQEGLYQELNRYGYQNNWTAEINGPQVVSPQAVKSKRLFKLFYKQLKRPHIRARTTRKQDGNYVFHVSCFTPSYFSTQVHRMALQVPRQNDSFTSAVGKKCTL